MKGGERYGGGAVEEVVEEVKNILTLVPELLEVPHSMDLLQMNDKMNDRDKIERIIAERLKVGVRARRQKNRTKNRTQGGGRGTKCLVFMVFIFILVF